MKPVGLEGSGGSTPLKMQVIDDHGVERSIFAKLYAKNHVRADRWYKLGRTMLYGRLEDETPSARSDASWSTRTTPCDSSARRASPPPRRSTSSRSRPRASS